MTNKMNQPAALFVLLALLLLPVSGRAGNDKAEERPNFVWIVSEDNSKHYMKLFDPMGISTPCIEALAREGVIYTHAFSNAPVCSVARSTLISSCYAPRTGTQYHRKSKPVPMPEGLQMFPVYLRNAGYYTTNNSKEDYNYLKSEGTWDESSTKAHWKNRKPDQPFFHMESHPDSHESRLHFNAGMMQSYTPVTDPGEVVLFPNHPDTELFRFTAAYYRDCILSIDSIVGKVVSELEREGILENTFVFYFSDHGGVLPGSKGYLYETGLHVPLVVRIPEKYKHLVEQERGTRCGAFVSFLDFGPTLLRLAGIPLPAGTDGKPFLGNVLEEGGDVHRQVTYGYADRFDEKVDQVRTVRKGHLKYMRSYQPFSMDGLQNNYRYRCLAFRQWRDLFNRGELNAVQAHFFEPREPEALYNLENDPYETVNLASDPRYRDTLLGMRTLLSDWVRGMPDLSFYPESYLFREAFDDPTGFGQRHRQEIEALIDIADLSLRSFKHAKNDIEKALSSGNSLKIYWGLIVCSSFGTQALPFLETAKQLCDHPDLLVRTRAAEFLAITGNGDPARVITGALMETSDPLEALLMLNSLVLLMDGYGVQFELNEQELDPRVSNDPEVASRLEYIRGKMVRTKNLNFGRFKKVMGAGV